MINRKFLIVLLLSGLFLLASACNGFSRDVETATPTIQPTETLPPPVIQITSVPKVSQTVSAFLDAWNTGDYESMYALLSAESQASVDYAAFEKLYRELSYQLALENIQYSMGDAVVTSAVAEQPIDLVLSSYLVDDIQASNDIPLVMEDGQWRITWSPAVVLPQLADGSSFRMDLDVSERGSIFDRAGKLLAGTAQAAAVGLYPDYMEADKVGSILSLLSRLTGLRVDTIENMYINYPPGTVGYLPLGEVDVEQNQRLVDILSGASGVVIEPYTARFYPGEGVASHAVGYISPIQQGDEEEFYRRQGYRIDANIGRAGIEKWGEELLAGKNGASLYLVDTEGKPKELISEIPKQAAQQITTTLESDFQAGVQQAIDGFNGAVVVMERDTGRILAMASSPDFDPNAYQTANYNWQSLLQNIEGDPNLPRYNRATQGQYPLGSVFKVITTAAGLESGRFTKESTYDCQYSFTELADVTLYDWTWDHFQEDGVTQPSGLLTLPQGVIRSCNPWFYHIGLDLFNAGLGNAISDMARAFGLGQKTGIEGVDEEPGNIPNPPGQLDATNIAIGQGEVLVTPLQVARFMAAIGNGGTLYKPQLIELIKTAAGETTFQFQPEEVGKLPLSQENLAIIQKAMLGVVESKNPIGTAFNTFNGFGIPVHGKTGTATAPAGEPHAWFAGYTAAENPDRPDIAIAVIVENQGEGSQWAAPIFRRVVELYFNGRPGKLYRWETGFGITKTPTLFGYDLTQTATTEEP